MRCGAQNVVHRGRAVACGLDDALEDAGFADIAIGAPVDNFGGTAGEEQARAFEVYGYAILASKPR